MNIISNLNMILAFIIELIALGSFGYLGTQLGSSQLIKIISAVVFLAVMIFVWGAFFAPKATHRLTMPGLFIGKLVVLLMPSYILIFNKNFAEAALWFVIVLLHLTIAAIQNQM